MEPLRALPVACSKKRRLSETVAVGRSCTSATSSLTGALIDFGRSATTLSRCQGSSPVGYSHVALYGGERLTPNRRAVADLEIPSSWTALTILTRRSSE